MLFWVGCVATLSAQFPGSLSDISSGRGISSGMDDDSTSGIPDTLILKYFKLSDITKYYDYTDSTLEDFFHQYDPAKRRWIDYQNLGNAGSSARSQIFDHDPYVGFHSGLRHYDLYNFNTDDFRFFENNVPHSDVFFTPVGGQQNFVIRSDFARSFDDNTSISLNYRRIRQQGFYSNQLTKTTNFGTALRFQSEDKRYTGFLSLISNVNEEGQNGGVKSDTFYRISELADRMTVGVVSQEAQTRHQQKQYSLINYYQLNSPETSKNRILLRYDLSFDRSYYKFNDEGVATDVDIVEYGNFAKEDRGIKFYNKINKLRNGLYAYMADDDRLNIRVGLVYDLYSIDQLGFKSRYNNLYADFVGDIPITKSISIESNGKLGLGDGIGDFHFSGSLNLYIGKWIDLKGGASLYRYTPSLMDRNLILNGEEFWTVNDNNFGKPVGTDLFGEFDIPILKLKGKIKQSLINNAIYYNDVAFPQQLDGVFSATSISLANELSFWRFGMENYVMAQVFNENIYNLPVLYTKHNLHITGKLFKGVLLTRLGAEVRISPQHIGADFSPVVGQFYQSDKELPFYPMADIYVTGKLQKFRFFLRGENMTNLFNSSVQFQIKDFPQYDFKFRFGVSWLLLN